MVIHENAGTLPIPMIDEDAPFITLCLFSGTPIHDMRNRLEKALPSVYVD